jgi:thiamine transporter
VAHKNTKQQHKTKIALNNTNHTRIHGELGRKIRLRGRLQRAVDPTNLNQIILAEGKELSNKNTIFQTRILAEATIFIALTIVLKDVLPPIYELPQGGSVTIAGLVPLIWFSLRRGVKYGVFAGIVYGLIHAILPGSYIIHPVQGLLDYPLAFAALGLAGISVKRNPIPGVAVGIAGRFLCSFLAGIIFFSTTPISLDSIWASAIYNGTYLIPEFVITSVVIFILLKRRLLHVYM